MKPFVGNPCGSMYCTDPECENCPGWNPVIYYGEDYKEIRLPKWKWLVNLLYKIEGLLLKLNGGGGTF
jgi:hypothetical protein